MNDDETTRREFIEKAAMTSAGMVVFGIHGCQSATVSDNSANRTKFITNVDDGAWFYHSEITPVTNIPRINADEWSVRVTTGETEVGTINYRLLKALEDQGQDVTYLKTLRCIFGPLIQEESQLRAANGLFRGIPLRRVLEETTVSPETLKLEIYGSDNFASAISMSRVNDEELLPVMLAYELNGAPIPPKFGGPVRLIAPEVWAFKCVKWLSRINATTTVQTFGTFENGPFVGRPEIDNPSNMGLATLVRNPSSVNAEVSGAFTMSGMAIVGGGRIRSVEYSVDDGAFQPAEIVPLEEIVADLGHLGLLVREAEQFGDEWPYPDVWVPWRFELDLPTGTHRVSVRSVDDQNRINLPSTADIYQVASAVSIQLTVT